MSDDAQEYRVGYKKPPLHTRFLKGRSGNPEGGRRHKKRHKLLAELLEEALDRRGAGETAKPRRARTRREAIVLSLIEKSVAGDLRAIKLLLDIVPKGELIAPVIDDDGEDAREFIKRALDRIAAQNKAAARRRKDARAAASAPIDPRGATTGRRLVRGYRAMAAEEDREREAAEWVEGVTGDIANDPR